MKRLICILLSLLLITACFSGCKSNTEKTESDNGKLKIISTIFPSYDFAKQICGDKADVTMLLPPGSESHSYEPSAQDIIAIQNCDLFIYVGGESDTWVDGILDSLDNKVKTVKMMDCVSAVEEETVEGMQAEGEKSAYSGESKETEYDEHVWTSPKNSIKIVNEIAASVAEIDMDNINYYSDNASNYIGEIEALDSDFTQLFSGVKNKTLIFGDRFPLLYFVREYGLKYYAAFPGCSNETEPSAATIAFLIDKVKTENIGTVFYIEFSNHLIADSITEATGAKTALFQTCHNVSQDDLDNGATYVSLMRQNLETLREAFN